MITSRILGIALAATAALCLFFYVGKAVAERRAAKFEAALVEANATIDRQNAAVEALKVDGDRRAKQFEEARNEAQAATSEADKLARKLERQKPLSGRCETPADIMEADL